MRQSLKVLFGVVFLVVSCKQTPATSTDPVAEEETSLSLHEKYLLEIEKLPIREAAVDFSGMVKIKGGTYLMGGVSSQARVDELPRHSENVSSFWMDTTEVTNGQFQEFVAATGYVTTAEREAFIEGQRYPPGALVFDAANPQFWWKYEPGAYWGAPQGKDDAVSDKLNHPVVQVSWYDAMAYAHWVGKRLPTEVEWEYAARGGTTNTRYYWGNDFSLATSHANFHQGSFPVENLLTDAHEKTAAVGSFSPNEFGLYDMAGNVWEWCLDTYYPNAYELLDKREDGYFKGYYNPKQQKVVRGGSFLCNESYCTGYRASARMSSTPDTGLEHTGFRLVYAP